jgi:predicted extracellular nuclease
VTGRFSVASANLNNFFFGPPFPTARGASSQVEFDRQWPKTVAALCGMNTDILAINELGNNTDANPDTALNFLVSQVNATTGCGPYTAIATGQSGTDAIRSAILYKAARVTPVGAYALLDLPLPELNRPSLAQTFKPATGLKPEKQYFTVVTNHYKARTSSSSCDADANDGQDSCNTMRLNMAYNVLCWLYGGCSSPYVYAGNPTNDPTAAASRKYLLVGDFNGYLKEDPFRALGDPTFSKAATPKYPAGFPANAKANFIDLMDRVIGAGAYSYNFGSQNGYLDHALANTALERLVSSVAEWHINTDEPTVFDYNVEFKTAGPSGSQTVYYNADQYRNSDHDPFVVGLNPLMGDLNDDGVVDANDGKLIQQAIGKKASAVDRRLDFDGDGTITLNDYRLWFNAQTAWNQ